MKKILIIYPHWPPSNLAGIHRPRLIGNYIHEFGWQPIVLTVKPEFYEEQPDPNIALTVSKTIDVRYTNAFKPFTKFRFFGDIGLRAFFQLKKAALKIIREEKIDFVWIPIPSFYVAVLGRLLHNKTNVKYGIDYIDPWVNGFTNYEQKYSKAWISNKIAKILEPYAVNKASLLSGVSTSYYQPVLNRNFKNKEIRHVGMPYGFDPNDHEIKIKDIQLPWYNIPNCKAIVYAGAFLPKSHYFIQLLFSIIAQKVKENKWEKNLHLFFIGTGTYPGKTIQQYANDYGITDYVHEHNERRPFLDILNILSEAYGIAVIGSTEKHYTASKIFQSLLSKKPVFAIFHNESSAVEILKKCNADNYLVEYKENNEQHSFVEILAQKLHLFIEQKNSWQPNLLPLNDYSAKASARALAEQLDQIIK